jgi:AraC-like DNA-binding protein
MKINFEDLGLRNNEVARFRSFSGDLFNCPLHYHDCFELTLIKSSDGILEVGNESYPYYEGQLFLFAPGVVHSFVHNEIPLIQNAKPQGLVLLINELFLNTTYIHWQESYLLKSLFENAKSGIVFDLNSCRRTKLIFNKFQKQDITGFEILKLVSIILFELAESKIFNLLQYNSISPNDESVNASPISIATLYIHRHFQENISVEIVAQQVNMSYSSFSRFFKQKIKMNFSTYLQKIRLSHAKKLLIETNLSINQVCYDSGFNNPSFFNRVFKTYQSCSPKEYRSKYQ